MAQLTGLCASAIVVRSTCALWTRLRGVHVARARERVGACVPTQVFAGRFDMRTMLAALYPIPPEVPPYFDHSQHDELW